MSDLSPQCAKEPTRFPHRLIITELGLALVSLIQRFANSCRQIRLRDWFLQYVDARIEPALMRDCVAGVAQ
jgi:hypothetical protein